MANSKKMDFVILGLLAHESMTGYEIKKRMDTILGFFWNASYGSIYPTLNELQNKQYVTLQEEKDGRREKKSYTITSEGKECLERWLHLPVEKDELRYETLLKLFFGSNTDDSITLQHIEKFEEKIRNQLVVLIAMESSLKHVLSEEDAHLNYLLTVTFGIKTYEAYLTWCTQAKNLLSKRAQGNGKVIN